MNSNYEADLKELVDGFRLSCQTEGESPKTIEWYVAFLHRFTGFLDKRGLSTSLRSIDKAQIRKFILYLQLEAKTPFKRQSLSRATVQGYVRSLKAFFSWIEREGYTDYSSVSPRSTN